MAATLASIADEFYVNASELMDTLDLAPVKTAEEFKESLAFVREMDFAGGHVFTYSPRPGTGAARMKGQVRPELGKKRNHILHEALEESTRSYRQKFVGRTMNVLWESTSEMGEWGWQMEGWTGNYLRVQAFAPSPRWNEVNNVLLDETTDHGMKGVIANLG